MNDNRKRAKGLEEISHLFLSHSGTKDHRNKTDQEKKPRVGRPATAPDQGACEAAGGRVPPAHLTLKSARKADVATVSSSALLAAAKSYLYRQGPCQDLVAVENMDSPQFGSSDLLFVNGTRTRIICARLSRMRHSEAFVVSAMAYYRWLRQSLGVGALFFGQEPALDMYLFANSFSPATTCVLNDWLDEDSLHLVSYDIWQVDGLSQPVARFRSVTPAPAARQKPARPNIREEPARVDKKHGEADPASLSLQQWETFQRLKERAFT